MWTRAIGLACGCCVWLGALAGLQLSGTPILDAIVDWVLIAALVTPIVTWVPRRRSGAQRLILLLSLGLLGFARAGVHMSRVDPLTLRHGHDAPETLVRVRGLLRERLVPVETGDRDVLDPWIRPPSDVPWRSELQILQVHDGVGWHDGHGIVVLLLATTPQDVAVGTELEVLGWMQPIGRGVPGKPCRDTRLTRCDGVIGVLQSDLDPLVVREPDWWTASQNSLHRWLDSNLLDCLGGGSRERHRALLVAMTTGRTLPGLHAFRDLFHQAGLSHFLAISGFNVAILLITARVLMEVVGLPWWMRGWCLALLAIIFVIAVAPGVSVARAGMSGVCAGIALGLRRGWKPESVLGTCMVLMLLWDPCLAVDLGFLLSFGAVLGLVRGTRPIQELVPDVGGLTVPPWVRRFVTSVWAAIAAGLGAWLMSIPITLHAVGVTHPWCAFTSTLLGPCAALITVLASMGAVLGWIPGSEFVFRPLLELLVECMYWGVATSAGIQGSRWDTGCVSGWWCLLGFSSLVWWWGRPSRSVPRGWVISAMLGWFMMALLLFRNSEAVAEPAADSLRWTCLSLGGGNAHVIQRGHMATVIDAGSRTSRSTGSTIVVPALRSLGIRVIDRIVVRRASIDRFSALPEVIEQFPVRSILLSSDWFRPWGSDTPQSMVLKRLALSEIPIHDLGLIDGWTDEAWTWSCERRRLSSRVDVGPPVLSLRADRGCHSPTLVFMRGCDESTIWNALQRRAIQDVAALEWPPTTMLDRLDQEALPAIDPGHVIQVVGDETPAQSLFRRHAGWRPWGLLKMDGALQFRLNDSGSSAGLFRWTCSGWVQIHRH
jgi:ComEC/Rec2-related protein